MAHLGFTPQSEHVLGGFRVQGRNAQAEGLVEDARRLEEAGAFAVLLEMTAAPAAAAVEAALSVPTVGIGAGAETTGQVLVWQDMAGLTTGRTPRFVKRYADLRTALTAAWTAIANVGPAWGPEVTANGSVANFPTTAKWLMIVGMYLGRLELITVFVVLMPRFWRQ